jgi:hypothetical protein
MLPIDRAEALRMLEHLAALVAWQHGASLLPTVQ